jgi:oligopeptide/dipeptide ABC transporter ATP-binding protein
VSELCGYTASGDLAPKGPRSALLHARVTRLEAIAGMPPDLRALPEGCSFAPRCGFAEDRCHASMPPALALAPEHMTRCLRVAAREIDLARPKLSERSSLRLAHLFNHLVGRGQQLGRVRPSADSSPRA